MRKSILLAAALLACASLLAAQGPGVTNAVPQTPEPDFKVTTVFLVRHAEKATDPPADPPLTEGGLARSRELARVLSGAGIRAVYTSQFLRATQTAGPLAAQLGLAVTPVRVDVKPSNPREVTEESVAELVKKIEQHAGEAVLVVGHSNTVPEVIRMLGGDAVPSIDEKKFDDLFVVTVYGKRKARVVRLKYGGQS